MITTRAALLATVAAVTLSAGPSHATTWNMTFDSWIGGSCSNVGTGSCTASSNLSDTITQGGNTLATFTGPTRLEFTAQFDDLSTPVFHGPNLASYAALNAMLTIGGVTYNVLGYDPITQIGMTVDLFDDGAAYGYPGHFAGGFINMNAGLEGAGMISDWVPTNPGGHFTNVNTLIDTLFSSGDMYGQGYNPGAIALEHNGDLLSLNLYENGEHASGNLSYYTHCTTPQPGSACPPLGNHPDVGFATDQQSQLTLVPEAPSIAMLAVGLVGLGLTRRRRAG